MKIGRRELLAGGVLTIAWRGHAQSQQIPQAGCMITDDRLRGIVGTQPGVFSFDIDRDTVLNGSGNKDFDRALAHTLANICDHFAVLPGFAFFEDGTNPNAFASPSKRLGRTDGSVVFGRELFQQIMAKPEHPEVGIVAVCAHEFGHIAQYKHGLQSQLIGPAGQVKRLELHADFLAGYFAGLRKLQMPSFPAATVAMTQFNYGDTALSDPNHHGTDQERGAAVVAGFQTAYHDKKDFSSALEAGIQYVHQIP